jgi:hypothetical protein
MGSIFKKVVRPGMVAHAYNPRQKKEDGGSRPAWGK